MKFNVVNFTGKKCEKKIGYCPSAGSGTKEEIGYALLKPGYWNADENYGY